MIPDETVVVSGNVDASCENDVYLVALSGEPKLSKHIKH